MKLFILLAMAVFTTANVNPSKWKSAKGKDMSRYIPKTFMVPPIGIFNHQRRFRQETHKTDIDLQKVYDFSDTCGRSISYRIVGGEEAVPHSFPWQAALFTNGRFHCGGTLITPEHVLTAAHCAAPKYDIFLGAHDLENPFEEGRIEITATETIVHENWDPQVVANDIAIIKLSQPVMINGNGTINVACLASEEPKVGAMVTATGWGAVFDWLPESSAVLRQVAVPVIDNNDCEPDYPGIITDAIVCIDTTGGHGTCFGDSGGPLQRYREEEQKWEHVGLTSFGSSVGCEAGQPAGFSRTYFYKDWISANTGLKI